MHTTIHLQWEPFKDAVGYHVGYDVPCGISKTLTMFGGPLTSCVVLVRLDPKQLHQFWVKAFDQAGNVSQKLVVQNVYQE